MSQERLMILKMLEEGKLSAEEAEKLLKAMGGAERSHPGHHHHPHPGSRAGHRLRSTMHDIGGAVGDMVANTLESVELPFFSFWGESYRFSEEFTGEFDPEAQEVTVDLSTRNGKIEVFGWEETGYKVVVHKKIKARNKDTAAAIARDLCTLESSDKSLNVDSRGSTAVHNSSVSLEIYLPVKYAYRLGATSSNGRIETEKIRGSELTLRTSNGRVGCHSISFDSVSVRTSNGRIELDGVLGSVVGRTTNGRVEVRPGSVSADAVYDVQTSNGKVILDLQQHADVGFNIEATTSMGKVRVNLEDLEYIVDERNKVGKSHVEARSRDFADAKYKVRVQARSSNGSVVIGRPEE